MGLHIASTETVGNIGVTHCGLLRFNRLAIAYAFDYSLA